MIRPEKNWLEWTVFAVSAALVLATLGYLAHDATTLGDRPPIITIATGAPVPGPGGYALPVEVRNDGDRTAEDVVVEVELEVAGGGVERAEATVAFLPREARSRVWMTFRADPRVARSVRARAIGYQQP